MNSLVMLLFASALSVTPVQHLTDSNNGGISYVCYFEDGELMLAKIQPEETALKTHIINTGISTNSIEKVTMGLENNELCLTIFYSESPSVQAFFERSSLEFSQISLNDPMLLADTGIPEE